MKSVPKEYLEFDDIFPDGRMTDPQDVNYDIQGAMSYCEQKGIELNQLSDEELKMFEK